MHAHTHAHKHTERTHARTHTRTQKTQNTPGTHTEVSSIHSPWYPKLKATSLYSAVIPFPSLDEVYPTMATEEETGLKDRKGHPRA